MMRWSAVTVLVVFSVEVFAAVAGPDISGTWRRDPDSQAEGLSSDRATATANERCKIEGMPTIMAAHDALEILQTPGQVTVLAEYMTQTRRIYLDEPLPALEDVNPGYMGYSVGKWQGNTLEIQTIGVRDDIRYKDLPHSAKMRISEKISLTAPDRLRDDISIVDPDVLTRPYRLTFVYRKDPTHRLTEYACDHKGMAASQDNNAGTQVPPASHEGQPQSK